MNSVLGEITLIQIADLGKIKFMSLRVEGKNLVRFVGPNEAGKSTVLDRLQNLFENASKIPTGIIRKGIYHEGQNAGKEIDRGMARIETSNGFIIEQVIRNTKAGEQKAELRVTQNGLPVQGGALSFLQSVSTKYPDPHVVANLSEKELFAELFSILNVDLSSFDAEIAKAKLNAQEARAGLKVLGAEKQMPSEERPKGMSEEEFDDLLELKRKAEDEYAEKAKVYAKAETEVEGLTERVKFNIEKISALELELENLKDINKGLSERAGKGQAWLDNPDNLADRKELSEMEGKISAHVASGAINSAWEAYDKDISTRTALNETLEASAEIVKSQEKKKKEAVSEVKVPATNMKLYDDGSVVKTDGDTAFHWDTLSMSARLTAATELCIATIPEKAFRAIYIERGESIGTEYRNVIAKLAAEKDVQVFMEVFSEDPISGDGIFMLEEGEIVQNFDASKEEDIKSLTEKELESEDTYVEGPIDIDKVIKKEPEPGDFGSPVEKPITIGVPDEKTFDLF